MLLPRESAGDSQSATFQICLCVEVANQRPCISAECESDALPVLRLKHYFVSPRDFFTSVTLFVEANSITSTSITSVWLQTPRNAPSAATGHPPLIHCARTKPTWTRKEGSRLAPHYQIKSKKIRSARLEDQLFDPTFDIPLGSLYPKCICMSREERRTRW